MGLAAHAVRSNFAHVDLQKDHWLARLAASVKFACRAVGRATAAASTPLGPPAADQLAARLHCGAWRAASSAQPRVQLWAPAWVKWKFITAPCWLAKRRNTAMRMGGGTKNIKNPPPPAPEILPADAPAARAAS